MDKKFGWILYAKRKTGMYCYSVLASLYPSYWPFCCNMLIFRKVFIHEMNCQWNYCVEFETFQKKIEYFKSSNDAGAGKYLHDNYITVPHDISNIQRLIDLLTSYEVSL